MTQKILEVLDVKKYFKDVKAVDGVDISINEGEFIAILGPNGAGKTTLVEMIEGIQFPDSGEIKINGKTWKDNKDELHRFIGLSLQENHFLEKLSVWETLKVFASFYNLESSRLDEILTLVQLESKRNAFVDNMSGGQKQRLSLGLALLSKPRLLLLDEPTTGLDPTARRELWEILQDLKVKEKISLVLTTHYMEEASYLCDYIVIMDKGKILTQGKLVDLLSSNNEGDKVDFEFVKSQSKEIIDELSAKYCIHWHDSNQLKGKLLVNDIIEIVPEFLNQLKSFGIELSNFECRKISLDDLFVSLTGRSLEE